MPKKKKQLAKEKTVQKKPSFIKKIPVVNGIQSRLGWLSPKSTKNTDYYMPKEEYDAQTEAGFHKLLKEHFGINLEADHRDAARRIFTFNRTGATFMNDYFQKMEEIDLMPDCKEKFQTKEKIAKDMEKGLFYEMAKGSLAIARLGENEPRQVLCDKDKHVFTVTEPFSVSNPIGIRRLYAGYQTRNIPREPREPDRPVFTKKEPVAPVPPAPFDMKAPGPRPEPPRIKAFTMAEPEKPLDIMDGKTREDIYRETYARMQAEVESMKPQEVIEDPGTFDIPEPRLPEEPKFEEELVKPEKPAEYDALRVRYDQLEKAVEQAQPQFDERFISVAHKPESFTLEEPKKPVTEQPVGPLRPEYKDIPGKPVAKYRFYEPQLILHQPDNLDDPGEMPQLKDMPEPPEKPALRKEPNNPGSFKRRFSWLIRSWKNEIADHEAWEKERENLPKKLEKYELDYAKWQVEITRKSHEHALVVDEYIKKKLIWDRECEAFGPENDMLRIKYEGEMEAYKADKAKLGDRFEAEKAKYEKELSDWQSNLSEEEKATQAENDKLYKDFEDKYSEFIRKDTEYNRNFRDCNNDPQKIAERKNELELKYERELKEYNWLRDQHEKQEQAFQSSVRNIRSDAEKAGRDPDAAEADYMARLEQIKNYDNKTALLQSFIEKNPVLNEYDSQMALYQEDLDYRESLTESYKEDMEDYRREHEAWSKEKQEYDKKLDLYKNGYKAVQEKYEAAKRNLKQNAADEAERLIRENEKQIREYPTKLQEYQDEKAAYDRAYANWQKGKEDMKKPGGLIYKWEEDVKAYNDAKNAHEEALEQYDQDVKSYPDRIRDYNNDLESYLKELEIYNGQMSHYKASMQHISSIKAANKASREAHHARINSNPIYQDYSFNTDTYDYGYRQWEGMLHKSKQLKNLQAMNAGEYKAAQQQVFKNYERRKKNAPEYFSAREAKEYSERVQEYNYLSKFPEGMKPYLKNMNRQEKSVNDSLNARFKKDSDISRNDYKQAAVEKMYWSVVRRNAEKYSDRGYFRNNGTAEINKLLDRDHAENAKRKMLQNKPLMKTLETEYDNAKKAGKVSGSLQDGDRLCRLYDLNYEPGKKNEAVKDPVLGEYHGDHDAIQKLKAKDHVPGIG